jgi:peroxiredoxin
MFRTIDSVEISGGTFKFNKAVELPELYGLTIDKNSSPYYVFLEDSPIKVQLDTAAYYRKTITTGSKAQELFTAYKKERGVKIEEFIKSNPASLVSAYVLYRDFSYRLSPQEIRDNVKLLDAPLHQSPYVKVLKELSETLETVQIGKAAPDFTAKDVNGKDVKLSQHQGKYLLVDFWAAWCGPCRRENPNVVKAYQKYKAKGFDVYGVSLDKSKAAWVKAIKDDGLNWTQVSDLAFWNSAPAKLYGVRAIPSNFLLDPNGIIVARNLRGEELEKALSELLDKAQAANR